MISLPLCARASIALLASLISFDIGTAAGATDPAASSLYARMGGESVVVAVVSETIDQVTADPKLRRSFKGSNIKRIKRLIAEQICDLAGGGCVYSGDSMREVHANHQITEAEFYGLVAILRTTMRRHQVALRERNELLALLAPMKRDVVDVTIASPTARQHAPAFVGSGMLARRRCNCRGRRFADHGAERSRYAGAECDRLRYTQDCGDGGQREGDHRSDRPSVRTARQCHTDWDRGFLSQ
jgi:hemoglobin